MAVTYGPNAALQKPSNNIAEALPSVGKTSKPSDLNFGDMVASAGKNLLLNVASKGQAAEQATQAAVNGEISELEHVVAVKEFEHSVSMGVKTIEKMTEAYKDLSRMLG